MKKLPVLHPFFFALFPLLSLFSSNRDQSSWGDLLWPAVIALGVASLLFVSLTFALKNRVKAGLITSIFLILFFSFGHVHDRITLMRPMMSTRIVDLILLVLWAVLLGVGVYVTIRARRSLDGLGGILNVVGALLVLLPLVQLGLSPRLPPTYGLESLNSVGNASSSESGPDIYYIVLDGYGRADVLADIYQHDNMPFVRGLEERGFRVAHKSRSNYIQTYLSIASSLNFSYLDELIQYVGDESERRDPLISVISDNAAAQFLRKRGYKFVAFETGYNYTEMKTADMYLRVPLSLGEFHSVLLGTTPIPSALRAISGGWDLRYTFHRDRILYVLDTLPEITKDSGPTFTFAHIMAAHPPFVFDDSGKAIQPSRPWHLHDGGNFLIHGGTTEEYIEHYTQQLRFMNTKILATVDAILERSPTPPIIILQGDHGPGSQLDWEDVEKTNLVERTGILNAIYFPDGDYEGIDDDLSPVNTFRVIFNEFFDADFEILDYRCYFSEWTGFHNAVEVTDRLPVN